MSRIKRPMYCICRRLASWLLMRFASSTASSRSSASAIDLNCVSGSPTSATPSACSSCISRFLRVLLTISSCTRCYHSAPMPKRHAFSCDPGELRSLAQVVLERARHAGANGCDCDVSEAYGLTVTVRKGQPDTIEHNRDRSVGVSIYLGERPKVRRGHASTSDFSRAALEQTVDAALAIARHTAEDECAGLPDADLLAREQPDLDLFHPWGLSTEEAIDIARRCEAAAFSVSKKIRNSEGATVAAHQSQFVFANSLGFVGGYPGSRHWISCSVIAEDKGLMQRDDWFSAARVPAKLAEPQALGRYAGQRAVARLCGAKARPENPQQCWRSPQPGGALRGTGLRRHAEETPARASRHRADGSGREPRDGRLLARRGGLLDRGRRNSPSRGGNHDCRQPERHVQGYRCGRQRRARAERPVERLDPG